MMRKGKTEQKRIAAVGWMPFWWGNKFCKRLAQKRNRRVKKCKEGKECG